MKKIMTGLILVLSVLMLSTSVVLAMEHSEAKPEPMINKVIVEMTTADGEKVTDEYVFNYKGKFEIKKNGKPMDMNQNSWGGNPPHNSEILSIHSRNPTWVCTRSGCGWR